MRWFVAATHDLSETEVSMAKPNYHHARREKERVRKARQQEKLQRRTGRDFVSSTASEPQMAPMTISESGQTDAPLQPEREK